MSRGPGPGAQEAGTRADQRVGGRPRERRSPAVVDGGNDNDRARPKLLRPRAAAQPLARLCSLSSWSVARLLDGYYRIVTWRLASPARADRSSGVRSPLAS